MQQKEQHRWGWIWNTRQQQPHACSLNLAPGTGQVNKLFSQTYGKNKPAGFQQEVFLAWYHGCIWFLPQPQVQPQTEDSQPCCFCRALGSLAGLPDYLHCAPNSCQLPSQSSSSSFASIRKSYQSYILQAPFAYSQPFSGSQPGVYAIKAGKIMHLISME